VGALSVQMKCVSLVLTGVLATVWRSPAEQLSLIVVQVSAWRTPAEQQFLTVVQVSAWR
jgi:hypothetical protein